MAKKRQTRKAQPKQAFQEPPKQEVNEADVKNYRCTVCNLVRKVKGAESNLLEMKCIMPSCTNNRFQFWKGEVKRLKILPTEEKVFIAMKGIVNV